MRFIHKLSFSLFLLLALGACSAGEQGADSGTASESQRLTVWLDEQFEKDLGFSPQWRTQMGDRTDYDKLDDVSEAALERQLQWRRESVAEMREHFDYGSLDAEAKTSYDIWLYLLEQAEGEHAFRRHTYLLDRGGPHASLPNFMINYHDVDSEADLQAYISRLRQIGPALEIYLKRAQAAAEDGIRQARFDYDFAIDEIGRVMDGTPFTAQGESPLWADAKQKIEALQEDSTLSTDEGSDYLTEVRTVLREEMEPAYHEVLAWLRNDRKQSSAEAQGAWALPNGDDYYKMRLQQMTTLDISAEEIHQIGLREVERLRGEMEAIKKQVGFEGSLQELFGFLREDPQFYFPNTDEGREAYLQLARDYLDDMEQKLPEYFGLLPQAELVVKRVEAFREQNGAAPHYHPGTPDGSRPGIFYAHLSDMSAVPKYQLEVMAYHEGYPGHHVEASIAQELEKLPRFRTQYYYMAFVEGWGLYAEQLAKEMGFYQDPWSDLGRLSTEIWRAIRLVVDTGLHARGWSEQEAVEYFMANSPHAEGAVRSEVKRYLNRPGQATAYKIGMIKILELREKARASLGDNFDIRGFHDTVLGGGALPLSILEARVETWMQQQRQP